MGDACGIGPETLVRAFADGDAADAVVVGDVAVLRRAARVAGLQLPVARIEAPADLASVPSGCLAVLQPDGLPAGLAELPWGRVQAEAGAAAARCIEAAAQWLLEAKGSAMVTAPLHKEALAAAGIAHPGHTEMLQALAASAGGEPPPVRMMLANDELRVVLVSIHVSLRRAVDLVTIDSVLETIRIAHHASASWGQPRPRIAVAGLNPHAGRGRLVRRRGAALHRPGDCRGAAAGHRCQRALCAGHGVHARAPCPGHAGEFDLVVAMTHDHGLIPVKYLGVEQGVNVTLGLPFVRTSPDHGTAFDIAGSGRADASSLKAALRMARRLAGGVVSVPA